MNDPTFNTLAFGFDLRRVRVERAVARDVLAREVGLAVHTVERVENGVGNPSAHTVARLVTWSGLRFEDYVLGGHG